ncbi:hypothetical protein BRCON_0637 [Candidatus Sumerlaea chitinivorans]|uniref:Uncharacterized protein n=1 Tax=Sumerlaea chitinivorans TaxID=2250252 RepID=A0A2Z4Y2W3_SUMC1|nr:hypothetical protein BRCON_0637 [Candidatus Sumerlaea chitinivorans]
MWIKHLFVPCALLGIPAQMSGALPRIPLHRAQCGSPLQAA